MLTPAREVEISFDHQKTLQGVSVKRHRPLLAAPDTDALQSTLYDIIVVAVPPHFQQVYH
jgi:hypothetical protein